MFNAVDAEFAEEIKPMTTATPAACGLALVFFMAVGCGESPVAKPQATAGANATTTVETAFNVGKLPTIELSVPDMMCEQSCVPAVRKALAARPGVKDVKVDLATKSAVVAIDKDKFDADAAVADLVDLGFKETKVAIAPVSTPQ